MIKIKLTFLLFLFALTSQAQTKTFIDQPYVEVPGESDTLVTPNEIFIKIILAEKDSKDKTSVEDQEKKMVEALKGLGIDVAKNLTTSDMASNFKSYIFKRKDILKSKEYVLKVVDAQTASKVFIGLENINISNTSIDKVDHSGLEAIRNLMLTKAVANARSRAISLSKPLKQSIGPAIHIIQVPSTVVRGYATRSVTTEVYYVNGVKSSRKGEEEPSIEFEKIPVNAVVNVKFILK